MTTQQRGRIRQRPDPHFQEVFKELLPDEYDQYETRHKQEVQEERKDSFKILGKRVLLTVVFAALALVFIFGVIIPGSTVITGNFDMFSNGNSQVQEGKPELNQKGGVEVSEAMSQLINGAGDFASNIAGGFKDLRDSMGTNAWSQFK